jgi:endonuclease G
MDDDFRSINRDRELREEILTRISEDPDLAARLSPPVSDRLRSVPHVSVDRARAILDDPSDRRRDESGLRAIILRMGRPVLLVRDDDFDLAEIGTDTWASRLEASRAVLRAAIRSVGRIELVGHPSYDWIGTGWVAADEVIVTNRHVAEVFATRVGEQFLFRSSLLGQLEAAIDFREEHGRDSAAEFRIAEVLHIEDDPGPDMAFLRIDWLGNSVERRPPIPLAEDLRPERGIAVIGYPAKDSRTRMPEEMDRIFGNVYDVKRLAPGETTGMLDDDRVVTHNASTIGGCSGSVVLDLEHGDALALHFAGREEVANYAVSAPVVLARLRQVLASAAVPGPAVTPPARTHGAPSEEDLAGRNGYDPDFLGPQVPHPALSPSLTEALAPVNGRDDGILTYANYAIRMHRHRRLAMYTAVNIDGAKARNVRRARDKWFFDPRMDVSFQAGEELYSRNKLDRGHLVRRLDPAWGDTFEEAEAATVDTFYFTNCAPQHAMLNQRIWLGLEDHILSSAEVHDLRVSVFSGPVFREDDRRYREFQVPEDFWKVVALVNDETGQLSVTGYMLSQRDFMNDLEFTFGPYLTYQIPLARVEEQTGLDFGELRNFDPLAGLETRDVRPLSALEDIRL